MELAYYTLPREMHDVVKGGDYLLGYANIGCLSYFSIMIESIDEIVDADA